jgi:restriction system protein
VPGLDRKRRGELLRSVFDVLADHPDGLRARDVLKEVEKRLGPTAFEEENYSGSDTRRFEKSVRFITINAVKAGWMVKDGGIWTATDAGLEAREEITDPEKFVREAQRLYKQWADGQPPKDEGSEDAEVEQEIAETPLTLQQAEESSWEEVHDALQAMDPYDFQRLVAGLLRGMGYFVEWIAPPGKDGGVDILALADPVGTRGPRVKVQVKREQAKTSAPTLRAFYSVLRDGDIGVFVTLGGFTSDAITEARGETRRIRLIDATQFFNLWVEHYQSIPEEDRRRLPIRTVAFLAPPHGS